MRTTKKILSMILAFVLVLGLLPATAFATGADSVYISVSFDGEYINDKNGNAIAYIPVSFENLASIDLDEYGLSDYKYDEDGDGSYETTALQLIIYAHENIYGGSWSDVNFTGAAGSSYFQGGIFGFDENLNYYLNGQYPLAGAGWGATSDQIVLEAGDFIDLASFSSWDLYQDSAYGFHFFADGNGEITHAYTAKAGVSCDVKLIKGTKDYEYNSVFYDVPDYEVFYGTAYGDVAGSVTTDGNGCASITFPTAGTYYLWVDGGYGNEYSEAIVSAPGYAKVIVNAAEEPTPEEPENPREPQSVSSVLNATMTQLAATVTEPVFGTTAGEWTVLSLARGNYYAKPELFWIEMPERSRAPLLIIEYHLRQAGKMDGLQLTFAIFTELLKICTGNNLLAENKHLPLSPLLREEVRKLDKYIEDYKLLCDCHIDTAEELFAFRENVDAQIVQMKAEREHIRNKIRRAPESKKLELKLQAKAVTQKMEPLRMQQRIAKRIAERSAPKIENLLAMERQQETEATRGRMKGARHDERNKSRTFSR